MAFISETLQMRRLTESGVNIKTTYIVDGTLRYRSTDGTCQDDVHSGIRCRKEYFRQGKLLHTEKIFDSRMEYTYVSGMDEEAQHTCENCGFTGKVKEFVNGCPCCDAASNIDYADKELGSKHHYDLVLQSPVYRIVTGVVDYIVSFLLCSLWIINTSRTFNGYDVGKIFIYSTILAMILYYFFYLCDAYAVLGPVRRYKEKQNRRQQEFWTGTGIDKKRFYNNLNYEAGRRYYSRPDVIDYDNYGLYRSAGACGEWHTVRGCGVTGQTGVSARWPDHIRISEGYLLPQPQRQSHDPGQRDPRDQMPQMRRQY